MPALGGASAEPLRFLDYLIYDPVRALLLHGAGVPVLVPAPSRFAVHKLIVASRRRSEGDGASKAAKDLAQSAALMGALVDLSLADDLADAWMEAWERGPAWRGAMLESVAAIKLAPITLATLAGGVRALGGDPADFGL